MRPINFLDTQELESYAVLSGVCRLERSLIIKHKLKLIHP